MLQVVPRGTSIVEELIFLPARSMAEKIRRKELSPVELIETHLRRIEQVNPKLNAFVQVDFEGARGQARAAEAAIAQGKEVGPLHGVPVSIKSSIDVRGLRCESGTRLRAGRVAETDAPLVERLRKAGAIIVGVTNTPELLMAWETDNVLYGRTNSPWDLSRTPGGSSGGEAAAIASGCSGGGVGSDGGGSIRVPAHFSGICGLKPTPGRIPATGHFPQSAGPFALIGVVGPMARTAGDLKLLFEIMQGPDNGDPSAAPVPVRWPDEGALKKLRIGYFEDDGRTPVTAEIRTAIQKAAESLRRGGFRVEPFRPQGLEHARRLWWKLFGSAGGMMLGPMTKGRETELSPLLKQFQGWIAEEPALTAESLLDVWIQRDQVRMQVFAEMKEFPVVLCPAAAITAFRHGERSWKIEGKTVDYLDAWSYSEWFNLLGSPSVVIPIARSAEGLPIGVQIAGLPWQEESVLSVAEALEAQTGWTRWDLDRSLAGSMEQALTRAI
jgi:Asp-tRNA(Asn)/Glu-tRNA(Gln) amidotransferase A subunit family amidase